MVVVANIASGIRKKSPKTLAENDLPPQPRRVIRKAYMLRDKQTPWPCREELRISLLVATTLLFAPTSSLRVHLPLLPSSRITIPVARS